MQGGTGNNTYTYTYGQVDNTVSDTGGSDRIILPANSAQGSGLQKIFLERHADGDGNYYDLTIKFSNYPTAELIVTDQFNPDNPDALIEQIDNVWQAYPVYIDNGTEITTTYVIEFNQVNFFGSLRDPAPIATYGTQENDIISNLDYHIIMETSLHVETITAGGGDDTVYLNHHNLPNGSVYADGGSGDDTIIASGDGVGGATNENTNFLPGGHVETFAEGGDGNDTMISVSGNNVFNGGTGDDTFVWQGGNLQITEAFGAENGTNDALVIDIGGISLSDLAFSTVPGTTAVRIGVTTDDGTLYVESQVDFGNFGAAVEWLEIVGSNMPRIDFSSYDTITQDWVLGGGDNDTLAGQTVIAGDGNDSVSGTAGDDILAGGKGDDTLSTTAGSDYLDAGDGDDTLTFSRDDLNESETSQMVGGRGKDTFELRLTAEQYASAAVQNDLLLFKAFLIATADTSTLHAGEFEFVPLGLTLRDIESLRLFVDSVEVLNFDPLSNTAPEALDDNFTSITGEILAGNVLADNGNGADRDVDENQTLTVTAAVIITANGGRVTLNADGSFTYQAADGFIGQDTFTYSISDGVGGTDTATATITVEPPPNTTPVAGDDAFDMGGAAALAGNVLGNDTDAEGDALGVITTGSFTTANGGLVTVNADGTFSYIAADGFSGSDSFEYTVTDTGGLSDTATVTLDNINGNADLPPDIVTEDIKTFATLSETVYSQDIVAGTQTFPAVVERVKLVPTSLINGVDRSNLTLQHDLEVKVNFISEGAGYQNTLGVYTIGPDGRIGNVQILAANLSGTGAGVFGGGSFNTGDIIKNLGTLAAGTELGFFIVADGFNKNNDFKNLNLGAGHFDFQGKNNGDPVYLTDLSKKAELVFINNSTGKEINIKGDIYHTASTTLNADGKVHAVSGINENGRLQIGFEDLYGYGDADFNDVLIEVEFGTQTDISMTDVLIANSFDITDSDQDGIAGATIGFTAGQQAGDFLSFYGLGATSGGTIEDTNITASFDANGNLVLSGLDSAANYEAVLRAVTLNSSAANPADGERQFEVTLTDASGQTDSSSVSVLVGQPNDTAPVGYNQPHQSDVLAVTSEDDYFAQNLLDIASGSSDIEFSDKPVIDLRGFDLSSYEGIDMTDGNSNDALALDIRDILDSATAAESAFVISGDLGDSLHLTGDELTYLGEETVGSDTFTLYQAAFGASSANVLIDKDIDLTAALNPIA